MEMNIYFSPYVVIIFGLACNIVGAILISLEAFGIKGFTEKLQNERTYGLQLAAISYVAMVNQFSVFILVNCLWVTALIIFADFSIQLAVLLFPVGYFLWRLLVKILGILSTTTYKLVPRYRTGEGCLKLAVVFFPLIIWVIIFGVIGLTHIAIQFGIDLPLRLIAERLLGKWFLSLLGYINNVLSKEHRTHLKVPSLLGAVLLIFGFIYQILGVILMILE